MSLLDRYGIKEVADVTFYELNGGKPGAPVLYLDTLKISTVEQTAEAAEVKGGKGNTSLMAWDYGKEITLNLEDALFSTRSLETMYGGKAVTATKPMVKNKYFTAKGDAAKGDKPFFKKEDGKWCFNKGKIAELGLSWGGEYFNKSEVVVSANKLGANKISVYIQSEYVLSFNEQEIDKDTTTVKPANIEIRGTVSGIDYSSQIRSFKWYADDISGEWTFLGEGEIELNEKDYNASGDMISVKGEIVVSYPVDDKLFFVEAGRRVTVHPYLIYDGERFDLLATTLSLTPEKFGADETAEEIFLSGPQWLELKSLEPNDNSNQIDISANSFPGTYYITADTYTRNEKTGKDEFFRLIIPRVKVLSETNTITMEADGEPTVFSMSLKALKPKNEPMMTLAKYDYLG